MAGFPRFMDSSCCATMIFACSTCCDNARLEERTEDGISELLTENACLVIAFGSAGLSLAKYFDVSIPRAECPVDVSVQL